MTVGELYYNEYTDELWEFMGYNMDKWGKKTTCKIRMVGYDNILNIEYIVLKDFIII